MVTSPDNPPEGHPPLLAVNTLAPYCRGGSAAARSTDFQDRLLNQLADLTGYDLPTHRRVVWQSRRLRQQPLQITTRTRSLSVAEFHRRRHEKGVER